MVTSGSFVGAGFDALPARVAILDDDGTIVYTNSSWDSVGTAQDTDTATGSVGTDYLAVCDESTDGDDNGDEAAAGIRAVADGRRDRFDLEYPCHTPDERRWFMMQASAYDHDDERYVLVMHVDITERRLLEEQAREQADRMESFATLLSHDLRNPLAVAMAEAQSLELAVEDEGGVDDDSDIHVDGASLRSSLERMEAIIDDALVLVKTDTVDGTETEPVRLSDAVDEAWSHVRTDDATISVTGSAVIRADRALLGHLLENLFRNSVEHGSTNSQPRADDGLEYGSTTPTIEVGLLENAPGDDSVDEKWAAGDPGARPLPDGSGNRTTVGFYVEDDGPGVPPADRERIFESGYTTNTDGTGFGLAIVQRVVDAHDWTITVTEGDRGGARFEVRGVDVEVLEREE